MLIRKLIVLLAFAPTWAFASGQIICNQVGNQTICNGAGGPQQPNFPEQMAAMQQAQAAQDQAAAAQMAARAQMLQAQTQARIAAQQQAEREAADSRQRAQAAYDEIMRQRQEERDKQLHEAPEKDRLRVQTQAAVAADTTPGLKAKAATVEAIMRTSPPDSETFRNATGALNVINEELAKRGALK
jgi:predicted lipid-binding transport protein (Tim44 family)